jgi:hypothetical protein
MTYSNDIEKEIEGRMYVRSTHEKCQNIEIDVIIRTKLDSILKRFDIMLTKLICYI